ncbi:hypothetical protein CNEO3_550016 [Clostridium neonatale]|nr:hypothetical protein CNEO4_1220032 [Clostridium neonatale]CAI3665064.1 hypothetical protein CNEO3_550016 [Clostridium neonatale]CAI3687822.1 hypothetical protein CNEO3_50089 [Clostridium neonatale]CAI4137879.1 hypothetical protein CNEO4_1210014 [Clostridium neonatale]
MLYERKIMTMKSDVVIITSLSFFIVQEIIEFLHIAPVW